MEMNEEDLNKTQNVFVVKLLTDLYSGCYDKLFNRLMLHFGIYHSQVFQRSDIQDHLFFIIIFLCQC